VKDDKEHIDKLFESLNDRQFDIPEAFLEDLNKRLDNEPKRRRFFFLWFLAPLVLIGGIGISYFLYSDKQDLNSSEDKASKLIAKDEYKTDSTSYQTAYQLSGQNQNEQQPESLDSIIASQKAKTQINT